MIVNQYRGFGSNRDVIYDKVVLLSYWDTPGSPALFRDEKGHALTAVGSAECSSAQSYWAGGSSLYIPGKGHYVSTPDSADWSLGTSWTIECPVYMTGWANAGNYNSLLGQRTSTIPFEWYVHLQPPSAYGPSIALADNSGNIAVSVSSTNPAHAMSLNQWHWVSISSTGSEIVVLMDRMLVGSAAYSAAFPNHGNILTIGHLPRTNEGFQGYIGPLRITKGAGRNPYAMIPPAQVFAMG